ncbi:unnamed protein product, partial [Polarella glacialis]
VDKLFEDLEMSHPLGGPPSFLQPPEALLQKSAQTSELQPAFLDEFHEFARQASDEEEKGRPKSDPGDARGEADELDGSPTATESAEPKEEVWCNLMANCWPFNPSDRLKKTKNTGMDDIRERMLEQLFDVTPERVSTIYKDIRRHSATGRVGVHELGAGLVKCGVHGLELAQLHEIFQIIGLNPENKERGMKLNAFEMVVSRLKLAQLLMSKSHIFYSSSEQEQNDQEAKTTAFAEEVAVRLRVVDYNATSLHDFQVTDLGLRHFLFGHRPGRSPSGGDKIRWVHLDSLELRPLLGLVVKYSLHPVSVEDVIDQCPIKLDRHVLGYCNHRVFVINCSALSLPSLVQRLFFLICTVRTSCVFFQFSCLFVGVFGGAVAQVHFGWHVESLVICPSLC